MSYTIQQSPAIVIATRPWGEADRVVFLLTQHDGLLQVVAKNTRSIESRMRYGTQFLHCATYEYVFGRGRPRLTGVHDIKQFEIANLKIFAPLCRDLVHFIQGQDPCPEIYTIFYNLLHDSPDERAVLLARSRILYALGYSDTEPRTPREARNIINNAYQQAQL